MMCVDVDDDARVMRDRVCDALVPQKRVDKIGQLSRLAEAHLQGHAVRLSDVVVVPPLDEGRFRLSRTASLNPHSTSV